MANWLDFAHPRAKEFFVDRQGQELRELLLKLANNTPCNSDPILKTSCVHWKGRITSGQAVIDIVKPGDTEETETFANRIIAFVFADDVSFEKLMQLPKEAFRMSCGNQLCVSVAHIDDATC